MQLVEMFADWKDIAELPKGAVIFSEGDPADYMYIVLEGEIELTLKDEPLGAEITGGVFGEMALVDATRSANAVAIKKTRLARITREQFRDLVRETPDLAIHVIAVIANRLKVAVTMALMRI